MNADVEALARLHSRIVDARKGYAEAIRLAGRPEMTATFTDLHDLHARHADALAALLRARGAEPDADGSFMALVHKAVLNVRAATTGLDAGALPGVIDGEERLLEAYDETRRALGGDARAVELLLEQEGELDARLGALEAQAEAGTGG
jgi:uncharacterized protein (TIGR02284 family)